MRRPDSSSSADERRVDPRHKIRKVGRVVIPSVPPRVVSCIIVDLSSTGARLLMHDKVPERISLFQSATRTWRDAVVVRRQQDTVGVRFEGEAQVLSHDDERMAILRAS